MLYSFLEGMGFGSCQTKRFLSRSLDEPNAQELQQIDAHYKQNRLYNMKNENISEPREL